ncbi:MAG TPA: hypothetical protein VFP22_01065, partial [Candidatus Limnocylindrales bacterium]|nr:hypothetical protein [Candidatus Limnocylindrales bacterium]
LLSMPLHRRRDLLRRILHPGDEVVAVPAIAGEGRALHDAAAAQGIAGVLARQRTSPYLPGVKSRLWRFVAASPAAAASAPDAGVVPDAAVAPDLGLAAEEASVVPAAAPVVALIRRLPLLFED